MSSSSFYQTLNSAWKTTGMVIFGEEIGELEEFTEYLKSYMQPLFSGESLLSGKPVFLLSSHYSPASRFISFDEVASLKEKFEPLSINEIKDIDSIIQALRERFVYVGNVVLGSSYKIENASGVVNVTYATDVKDLLECSHVAYCSRLRFSKYCFGVDWGGNAEFAIRCADVYKNTRCFESFGCYESSDCYYSFGVRNSSEVMFCFGGTGWRYRIGNLELSKDKYMKIKEKIVREIAEELKKDKSLPGLLDLVPDEEIEEVPEEALREIETEKETEEENKEIIERAFNTTVKTVLGEELEGTLDDYVPWLFENVLELEYRKSFISGKKMVTAGVVPYYKIPPKRAVTLRELSVLSKYLSLDKKEVENLSFKDIGEKLRRFMVFSFDNSSGNNKNVIDTALVSDVTNLYKCLGVALSKFSAASFWPRNSSYTFGCYEVFRSTHSLKSYFSEELRRSFEVDCCYRCNDIYFSHYCEGCGNVMFTFRRKGARYEIGNVKLSRDQYSSIRSSLLGQIVDELNEKKRLEWSIYTIGSANF